jgi:membrane protease YdiL (CAAX protease family)
MLDAPSAASVPRAIRRRSPATFVVLVVALSVPFWVVGTFVPGVRLVGLPVSALLFVAPLGAALILIVREEGRAAAMVLVRRTLAFGSVRPRLLYLPLLTVLPAIYASSWLVQRGAGRPVPPPDVALGTLAVVVALFLVTAVAEEAGWSGYATAPMLERHGILATGVALGLAWALIHVVPDIQNGHDLGWIAFHRLGSVGLRLLLVTAFAASGGSVAAAVLMHATDNISWAVVTAEGAGYDPAITGVLVAVTGLAAALLATRLRRPMLPAHQNSPESA